MSNAPPKCTPLLQMANTNIVEPAFFDDKLLMRLAELRDSKHTGICGLISIRITGLEERSEGASIAFVDYTV